MPTRLLREIRKAERARRFLGGVLLALALAACGERSTSIHPEPDPLPAPDVEAVFAPATPAEIEAVRAEWSERDVTPLDVRVEHTDTVPFGLPSLLVTVLSHAIEGGRHYGAVVRPLGAPERSLPVVVYAHGDDAGVSLDEFLWLTFFLDGAATDFAWVIPSFRSEPLHVDGRVWRSDGEPSPWDRDVDDALGLLEAALELAPAADGDRVGVLGFSRGAGVGLLMGIRDPRIDRVVSFFGPTDFFGPYVRDLVERALDGHPRNLPGLDELNRRFIQPFADGALGVEEVRYELVRRSAVLFAADLPPVQIHHGTADAVVDVSQAEALIEALESLGRGAPTHGFFLYPGGGHNPLTLDGSVPRTGAFLQALTGPAAVASQTSSVLSNDGHATP